MKLALGYHSVPSGFSHVFVKDTNLAIEPLKLRKILPLTSLAPSSNVLLRLRRFGFIEETYKNDRVRMIWAYVSRQGSRFVSSPVGCIKFKQGAKSNQMTIDGEELRANKVYILSISDFDSPP